MRRAAAFSIVSLLILVTVGCESIQNEIYKSAIEKAIHEDALTGHEPTYGHTAAMRQVTMTDCPQDFRVAYMNHIHAWDERAAVNQAKVKLDNEEDVAAAGGVIATIFGSDATPWSDHVQAKAEVQRLEDIATNDVTTTWREVEVVAAKYGVKIAQ